MNRHVFLGFVLGAATAVVAFSFRLPASPASGPPADPGPPPDAADAPPAVTRTYANVLEPIADPRPLLADFPQYVEPIVGGRRFEAPALVDDPGADLEVRAWRFSYNARGIVEIPNRVRARETAVVVVHPWAVDDEWGWKTPEPNGAADFCTPEKNSLAYRHTREVIDPFLKRMRDKVACVVYSLPGTGDPIRTKLYRSIERTPTAEERAFGERELRATLAAHPYSGSPLPAELTLGPEIPVADYFRQFPGLDAGTGYNGRGFWDLPIPVSTAIDVAPEDVVVYDAEGYSPLREFLKGLGVRHVLLTGYATDMCFCRTTAGYENLSPDFDVFLVGDATLATFPANETPRFATNAHVSFAALDHLVTQVNWVRGLAPPEPATREAASGGVSSGRAAGRGGRPKGQ